MVAILFRKWHLFFVLSFILNISVFSEEINYSMFSSFNELISYETNQIHIFYSGGFEDLSNAYLNRGESHLLAGNYNLAVEDLKNGYELAEICDPDVKPMLMLRSLLGLVFSYGIMDEMEEFHSTEQEIRNLFDTFECKKIEKRQDSNRPGFRFGYSAMAANAEKPILGPDEISISECVRRARTIAGSSRILISNSRVDVQTFLNTLISDLEERSVRCCYAGGVWKACLQPIANKWQKWNEKWNVFGIPPNPAWD